jgi:hypothetical protein
VNKTGPYSIAKNQVFKLPRHLKLFSSNRSRCLFFAYFVICKLQESSNFLQPNQSISCQRLLAFRIQENKLSMDHEVPHGLTSLTGKKYTHIMLGVFPFSSAATDRGPLDSTLFPNPERSNLLPRMLLLASIGTCWLRLL